MSKNAGVCKLCLSPYRAEVLALKAQKLPIRKIYNKYANPMGYTGSVYGLNMLIRRHIAAKHNNKAILLPDKKHNITPATIEAFSQKMLDLGMMKVENINPDNPMDMANLRLGDVVAAQKLSLEAKKLRLTEDAMDVMLGKMFAPPSLNESSVEGEIVSDTAR